jgi:zinc transport system substrate-binding protein
MNLVPIASRLLTRLAVVALTSLPLATHAQALAPLPVFVSILPQKQIVERIGGDAVKVDVLVLPGQNPATYDPSPQQMVALAQAVAYFRIGAPFETTWVPRIQQAHPRLSVVDTRQGISLQPMAVHDHGATHAPVARAPATAAAPARLGVCAAEVQRAIDSR